MPSATTLIKSINSFWNSFQRTLAAAGLIQTPKGLTRYRTNEINRFCQPLNSAMPCNPRSQDELDLYAAHAQRQVYKFEGDLAHQRANMMESALTQKYKAYYEALKSQYQVNEDLANGLEDLAKMIIASYPNLLNEINDTTANEELIAHAEAQKIQQIIAYIRERIQIELTHSDAKAPHYICVSTAYSTKLKFYNEFYYKANKTSLKRSQGQRRLPGLESNDEVLEEKVSLRDASLTAVNLPVGGRSLLPSRVILPPIISANRKLLRSQSQILNSTVITTPKNITKVQNMLKRHGTLTASANFNNQPASIIVYKPLPMPSYDNTIAPYTNRNPVNKLNHLFSRMVYTLTAAIHHVFSNKTATYLNQLIQQPWATKVVGVIFSDNSCTLLGALLASPILMIRLLIETGNITLAAVSMRWDVQSSYLEPIHASDALIVMRSHSHSIILPAPRISIALEAHHLGSPAPSRQHSPRHNTVNISTAQSVPVNHGQQLALWQTDAVTPTFFRGRIAPALPLSPKQTNNYMAEPLSVAQANQTSGSSPIAMSPVMATSKINR